MAFGICRATKVHFSLGLVLQRETEKWVQPRNITVVHSNNVSALLSDLLNHFIHRESQDLSRVYQDISPDTILMQPARKKDI